MFKLFSPLAIAGALLSLACLGAGPAQALSKVTFVSGKGVNTSTCADPANPCRTFQFAISQTNPGGEVKALDPAIYNAMVLTQSISITGIEGAGIDRNSLGDAITINAGPNDVVNLSHLTLDGLKIANNGIVLNSGGSLTITHCTVRNFADAIQLRPTGSTNFLVDDTLVSDNTNIGILVFPQGTGTAKGTLDHVSANKNFSNGIFVDSLSSSGGAFVTAVDSVANNNGNGFSAQGNISQKIGVLRLARSAATGNSIGVEINLNGTVESFGDNDIRGNVADVSGGNLTPVVTQ